MISKPPERFEQMVQKALEAQVAKNHRAAKKLLPVWAVGIDDFIIPVRARNPQQAIRKAIRHLLKVCPQLFVTDEGELKAPTFASADPWLGNSSMAPRREHYYNLAKLLEEWE
jgi:hypothetical protein